MALISPSDMSEELQFGMLLVGINADEVLQQFEVGCGPAELSSGTATLDQTLALVGARRSGRSYGCWNSVRESAVQRQTGDVADSTLFIMSRIATSTDLAIRRSNQVEDFSSPSSATTGRAISPVVSLSGFNTWSLQGHCTVQYNSSYPVRHRL